MILRKIVRYFVNRATERHSLSVKQACYHFHGEHENEWNAWMQKCVWWLWWVSYGNQNSLNTTPDTDIMWQFEQQRVHWACWLAKSPVTTNCSSVTAILYAANIHSCKKHTSTSWNKLITIRRAGSEQDSRVDEHTATDLDKLKVNLQNICKLRTPVISQQQNQQQHNYSNWPAILSRAGCFAGVLRSF